MLRPVRRECGVGRACPLKVATDEWFRNVYHGVFWRCLRCGCTLYAYQSMHLRYNSAYECLIHDGLQDLGRVVRDIHRVKCAPIVRELSQKCGVSYPYLGTAAAGIL